MKRTQWQPQSREQTQLAGCRSVRQSAEMRAWAKLLQGDPGYQDYIVVEPTTLDGEPGFILAAIADVKNRIVVGSQPGSSLGSMFSMQRGTIVCIGEPSLTVPGETGTDHSDLLLVRGYPTSLPLGTKWEYALVQLFGQEAVDAIVQRYDEESDEQTEGQDVSPPRVPNTDRPWLGR